MNNQPVQTTTGGFNALLDKGSEFEGKLTFEGTVRIDGRFKGEIFSEANLIVGESGKVEADIKVKEITVQGEIDGNIIASDRVIVKAPGVVRGNINTPTLTIEDGVTFEGHCTMSKSGRSKVTSSALLSKNEESQENSNSQLDS